MLRVLTTLLLLQACTEAVTRRDSFRAAVFSSPLFTVTMLTCRFGRCIQALPIPLILSAGAWGRRKAFWLALTKAARVAKPCIGG